jgi:hypothetical protein
MRYRPLLVATSLLYVATAARPAGAMIVFFNQLKADVLDKLEDKKFVEEVTKTNNRCFVCHQGKDRKNRNVMGLEMSKLIKKTEKDKAKISAAIKKVLELHVDPKDEKSETYLDRLKHSKWPAGKLEDLKKEPKKDEKK